MSDQHSLSVEGLCWFWGEDMGQPALREGFGSSLQEESASTGRPEAAKAGEDSVKVLEAEIPGLPPRGKHRPPPTLLGLRTISGRTSALPAPDGSRPGTEYLSGHSWHEDSEDGEGQGASAINSQTSTTHNRDQRGLGWLGSTLHYRSLS